MFVVNERIDAQTPQEGKTHEPVKHAERDAKDAGGGKVVGRRRKPVEEEHVVGRREVD